jgi:hypothetical protein
MGPFMRSTEEMYLYHVPLQFSNECGSCFQPIPCDARRASEVAHERLLAIDLLTANINALNEAHRILVNEFQALVDNRSAAGELSKEVLEIAQLALAEKTVNSCDT